MSFQSKKFFFYIPDFVEIQRKSFLNFLEYGLEEELDKRNPLQNLEKGLEFRFYPEFFKLKPPKYTLRESIFKGKTYECELYVPIHLFDSQSKKIIFKWFRLANLPFMTKRGHFIINGAPRVIINQLSRCPGVYFSQSLQKNKPPTYYADLIPQRGAWLRLEMDKKEKIWVRLKKTPKISFLIFLQAMGVSKEIIFQSICSPGVLKKSLLKDNHPNTIEAALENFQSILYKTSNLDEKFFFRKFYNPKTYNLGKVGRESLNKKLALSISSETLTLTPQDLLGATNYLLKLHAGLETFDDIDNLKNRKLKTSGELLQNLIETGLMAIEKRIKKKEKENTQIKSFSYIELTALMNKKITDFFGCSPLSQFMDQTNPLAEITHKRRLTSLGPGGVSRETAGMAVRGIHSSHYGRICPIETPEGQNAGLVNSLTTFAKVTRKGFLETPFQKVYKGQIQTTVPPLYFSVEQEQHVRIAAGDLKVSKLGFLPKESVPIRQENVFTRVSSQQVEYMAISPLQMISVATALIPFLEHDDANRALMGSNMQRQAVPLLKAEIPVVATGLEARVISDSGHVIQASHSGYVSYAAGQQITLEIPCIRVLASVKSKFLSKTLLQQSRSLSMPKVSKKLELRSKGTLSQNFVIDKHSNKKRKQKRFLHLLPKSHSIEDFFKKNKRLQHLSPAFSVLDFVPSHSYTFGISASFKEALVMPSDPKAFKALNYVPKVSTESMPKLSSFVNKRELRSKDKYSVLGLGPKAALLLASQTKGGFDKNLAVSLKAKAGELDFFSKNSKFLDKQKQKKFALNSKLLHLTPNKKSSFKFVQGVKNYSSPLVRSPKPFRPLESFGSKRFAPLERSSKPYRPLGFNSAEALNSYTFGVSARLREALVKSSDQNQINSQIYKFQTYLPTNQETFSLQKALVHEGDWVSKGDFLTDGSASVSGELALGKNILLGYMPWEGYNFEDAIVISDRLITDDVFTSLHIQCYSVEIQETELGLEQITKKLPEIDASETAHLDENGITKIGSWVQEGAFLVGKVTPRRTKELSPHEKLLYDIVGKQAPTTRNSSLRVPVGVEGRVVHIEILDTQNIDKHIILEGPGRVDVYIAQKRKIQVGDKLAGRHGNKGVISRVLPRQDMPYLPDGKPLDMILNPLGVPSRMNVGQIFECLLGLAGFALHEHYKVIPFDEISGPEASRTFTFSKLYEARSKTGSKWLFEPNHPGKIKLCDGRDGLLFDQPVTVGYAYMLKLAHLVDKKIHARSTGPYALVTQQPLGGRSKHGGQRFGEMEVWALEGYGAAYTLQELFTVKSDDIVGRQNLTESLLYNKPICYGTPESFKVLVRELQSLCLDIGIFAVNSFGKRTEVDILESKMLWFQKNREVSVRNPNTK